MRQKIAILILILSILSCAKPNAISDKKPTKQNNYNEDNELEYIFLYQYDGDKLVRWEQYSNSDSLLKAYSLEYNREEQLVRQLNYNGEYLKYFVIFEYNEAGLKVKQSTFLNISNLEALGVEEDSALMDYSIFDYDHYGNCVRQSRFDENDISAGYTIYEYVSVDSENSEDEFKIKKELYYDENNSMSKKIEYEYDSSALLAEMSETIYSWNMSGETFYEYDEKGNLIKKSYYTEDSLKSYTDFQFDKNNREISSTEYYKLGNGDLKILLQKNNIYDSSGNVIEKRIYDDEGISKSYILYEYTE